MTHHRKAMKQMEAAQQRYVLERDRRPPHEVHKRKACETCKVIKDNTFAVFPEVAWGSKKLGRVTTGPTCRQCCSEAVSRGMKRTWQSKREAGEAMDEDLQQGRYLTKK